MAKDRRVISQAPRGRGAASNPANRFEKLSVELEETGPERLATQYLRDRTRTIIARNDSPDIPFDASVNPYRGCEHGCAYCYARPFHEYLGFSAGLDFESRILVKENAPELLRRELASPRWRPQILAMSGVTDPYQPVERRLEITRRCLLVLAEARSPVAIITKNALVTRDLDHLSELARNNAAMVLLSITTLDGDLARRMEPRASHPRDRLGALRRLREAGIPCGVMMAPVVPGVTDHEAPAILAAAAEAGASWARFIMLRLPGAVAPLFEDWLERWFPDRKEKVLNRLRDMRDGDLYRSEWGERMRGKGVIATSFAALFAGARRRAGLYERGPELSTASFRRPGAQLGLFAETAE